MKKCQTFTFFAKIGAKIELGIAFLGLWIVLPSLGILFSSLVLWNSIQLKKKQEKTYELSACMIHKVWTCMFLAKIGAKFVEIIEFITYL